VIFLNQTIDTSSISIEAIKLSGSYAETFGSDFASLARHATLEYRLSFVKEDK
jgi:hypothetical protein